LRAQALGITPWRVLHGGERARIKPTRETRGLLETGWKNTKRKLKRLTAGTAPPDDAKIRRKFGGRVWDGGAAARACASAGAAATDTLHNVVTVAATC